MYDDIEIFPSDNPWNTPVDKMAVDPRSHAYLTSVGLDAHLHPDFGTVYRGAPNGIPFIIVGNSQQKVPVRFRYASASDKGPYPIPDDVPIEGGPDGKGDRHAIMVHAQERKLYELFHVFNTPDGWKAGSGAIWDLTSNALRPSGWTSADAAGLPIFPGLARYDEVAAGAINHTLRFTVRRTQRAYVYPARHFASPHTDPDFPPMGMRVRLRADYDISRLPPQARVIAQALDP